MAEAIGEEAANERHVVDDRRRGQRTLVAQVVLERARLCSTGVSRRRCDPLRGDHAVLAQKVQKVSQRGRITVVHLHSSSARSQVPFRMLG